MTKLREISEEYNLSFSDSIGELKLSMLQQIFVICIAFVVLVLKESITLSGIFSSYNFIANTILVTLFIYEIYIVSDLAMSIFVILDAEKEAQD